MKELNVICMKWGNKYDSTYVNRLYDNVEKNLTLPHRFICLTDDSNGIKDGIEIKPLPYVNIEKKEPERGWQKLAVFQENLFDIHGIALFMDIDTVILENLDEFFLYDGDFLMIKDEYYRNKSIIGSSAVFRFEIGKYAYVLNNYNNNSQLIKKKYRNEQIYLSHMIYKQGKLSYWPKEWCPNFKWRCIRKWPIGSFFPAKKPENARVIVFSGTPNPIQAYNGYNAKGSKGHGKSVKPTKWLGKYLGYDYEVK